VRYTMLDDLDKKIIHYLQGDIPLVPSPFAVLAEKIGIPEKRLIERIRQLKEQGILRRFGATLYHQLAGFKANAMIAWHVPEEKIEEIGSLMASFREVSHCYQRKMHGNKWKYNLFTMIHGKSRKECHKIAENISHRTDIKDYTLLISIKEFKKSSPVYF
jgi:DNA-binding Lrp family transcriptional regulator